MTDAAYTGPRHVPLGDPLLEAEPGKIGTAGALLGAVAEDLSTLMQQEIALAKAEATQAATNAGKGAGMMAGAAQGAQFALLFASVALWWALGAGLEWGLGWSAVIVAVLWAAVAGALAMAGKTALARVGVPRTLESAREIPPALKGEAGTLREVPR
mgnify:CR=1 FL=1